MFFSGKDLNPCQPNPEQNGYVKIETPKVNVTQKLAEGIEIPETFAEVTSPVAFFKVDAVPEGLRNNACVQKNKDGTKDVFLKKEHFDRYKKYINTIFSRRNIFGASLEKPKIVSCDQKYILRPGKTVLPQHAQIPYTDVFPDKDKWTLLEDIFIDPKLIELINAELGVQADNPMFMGDKEIPNVYYVRADKDVIEYLNLCLQRSIMKLNRDIPLAEEKDDIPTAKKLGEMKDGLSELSTLIAKIDAKSSMEDNLHVDIDPTYILNPQFKIEANLYEIYSQGLNLDYLSRDFDVDDWALIEAITVDPNVVAALCASIDEDPNDIFRRGSIEGKYFVVRDEDYLTPLLYRLDIAFSKLTKEKIAAKKAGNIAEASELEKKTEQVEKLHYQLARIKTDIEKEQSLASLLILCLVGFGIFSGVGHDIYLDTKKGTIWGAKKIWNKYLKKHFKKPPTPPPPTPPAPTQPELPFKGFRPRSGAGTAVTGELAKVAGDGFSKMAGEFDKPANLAGVTKKVGPHPAGVFAEGERPTKLVEETKAGKWKFWERPLEAFENFRLRYGNAVAGGFVALAIVGVLDYKLTEEPEYFTHDTEPDDQLDVKMPNFPADDTSKPPSEGQQFGVDFNDMSDF